jgi:integrase/recombinase XerD
VAARSPAEGPDGRAELPVEVEGWLVWLDAERGRAAATLSAYRRDVAGWCAWLLARGLRPADATPELIEAWVGERRAGGRAPSSVARSLVAVRSLHRFLVEEAGAANDPAAAVAMPRVPRGLPKALTEGEITSLLDAVVGHDPVARRDRAILEVLYGTGMRISELVGLSLGDVDVAGGTVRAFGKGSRERIVPLAGVAAEAVAGWLEPSGRAAMAPARWARRGDAEALLLNARGGRLTRQGAWLVVKGYGDRVGLGARLTPHVLRHSCATHMLDHGADIRVVQELLGHASLTTTQVYTLVSSERLTAVYAAAHPRAAGSPHPR